MAKYTPGAIISELSGSIAAVTYSRNRGGAYSKPRMTQTNPNSAAQIAIRAINTAAVAAWQALSPAVQESWKQFATTQNSAPTLGQTSKLSGYTAFMRFYIMRNLYGLTGDPVPRIQEPFANSFDFSFAASDTALTVSITSTNTNADVMAVFYLSDGMSPGRTTIPESKAVIMHYEVAPNGILLVDLITEWIARFGSIAAASGKKIFCRIELVNRVTAQSVVVFRSSSILVGAPVLFAVGQGVSIFNSLSSPDAISYTSNSLAFSRVLYSMCYSPTLGLFIAVSLNASTTSIATSPDGINWTLQTTAFSKAFFTVIWVPFLNLFIASGSATSTDSIATSPDGINWTLRTTPAGYGLRGLAYSTSLGLVIAIAAFNQGSAVLSSPDGVNWSIETTPFDIELVGIAYSPSLGLFAACGLAYDFYSIITSPDGVNWTGQTSDTSGAWQSIAWSPTLNLFACIDANGGTSAIQTSPDGITWTLRTTPSIVQGYNIIWSTVLNLFIASLPGDTPNGIMTSPDGINWTQRNSGPTLNVIGIAELEPLIVSAAFNLNASAQNVPGWNDVSGNPHSAQRSATDTATGIGLNTGATTDWTSFGGNTSNNTGGAQVDDGNGYAFPVANDDGLTGSIMYGRSDTPGTQFPKLVFTGLDNSKTYKIELLVSFAASLVNTNDLNQTWNCNGGDNKTANARVSNVGNTSVLMTWTGKSPSSNEIVIQAVSMAGAGTKFYCPAAIRIIEE